MLNISLLKSAIETSGNALLTKGIIKDDTCNNDIWQRFVSSLIAVLEVITEQRGGDLESLYKICRSEYEKPKSRHKHPKNGK